MSLCKDEIADIIHFYQIIERIVYYPRTIKSRNEGQIKKGGTTQEMSLFIV